MPTILLLDCNIFFGRSALESKIDIKQEHERDVFETEESSVKDILHRGISHFLEHLEEKYPFEFTSLIAYSTISEIKVPFTRDFGSIKNALKEVIPNNKGKSNLNVGLKCALDHADATWGSDTPFQVILITDANPGEVDISKISVPTRMRLHIISLGFSNDLDHELFQELSRKSFGTFQFLELPHNSHSFKGIFDSLIASQFSTYVGTIYCGHLNGLIQLYPNPNSILKNYTDFPSAMPSKLSVYGFIPNKKIQNPTGISRHVVVTPNNSSLCALLNESLKSERMSAIVFLNDSPNKEWFGLITSVTERDKSSGLVFTIFPPNHHIPWIGSISNLSPNPTSSVQVPLKTLHPKSYHSQSKSFGYSIRKDNIQMSLQKVVKYCRNLGTKSHALLQECEKVRKLSKRFFVPTLLESLIEVLELEIGKFGDLNLESKQLLNALIDQLKQNKPLEIPSFRVAVETPRVSETSTSKSSFSISSILN